LLLQIVFIALQTLDFVTTMIVLHMGGNEANPLVSHFMVVGSLQGLLYSKVIALTVGVAAVRARKYRVLRIGNIFFGAVVAWNLFVIVGTVVQRRWQ
jgi:hypothetical protein